MSQMHKKSNTALPLAGLFLATGVLLLVYAMFMELQVPAFIGLGLTFWGAVLALARGGKYVESSLLDSSAHASYVTIDRMINDLKANSRGYYIPAYPKDVFLPDYLKNLRDPVVYVSESFDGKPPIDELAAGKFISSQNRGFFISSPGSGIISEIEKQLSMDMSKVSLSELCELLPKCLTENLNVARNAEVKLLPDGATFKAVGILYESLYNFETRPKSVNMLGCPVVSAVACALAKSSGKAVIIKEQLPLSGNSVSVTFGFV
ncbi:hypothetical protein GX563_10510 [Candidatus Bathyarchaeota archaeon]|nr:hypothetical protein [Candidatus Bathyarchaeota archaeon]